MNADQTAAAFAIQSIGGRTAAIRKLVANGPALTLPYLAMKHHSSIHCRLWIDGEFAGSDYSSDAQPFRRACLCIGS
jgi:hypothetical protein